MTDNGSQRRVEVRVSGVVQGVGFRPYVYTVATSLGLVGHVGNDNAGVFIDAQGDATAVADLLRAVHFGSPMSHVERVEVRDLPAGASRDFVIADSTSGTGTTSIPPDTAVCQDCLAEMHDPHDRRFGYPFIACAHCGPRFTIATGLPYDREHTTMVDFPLCSACDAEYRNPASRRFHAQPTACPECGPKLSLSIERICELLQEGAILAIKGVGGYHLTCDASNADSVARLRARKQRGDKPFAIMTASIDSARSFANLDDAAVRELESPARPIVLAPAIDARLQGSVAPGNGYLGVMLPYAPLHYLLFEHGAPQVLVTTSGNVSDEPICISRAEAEERLTGLADDFVHHNRRIHVACDDSVMRASSDAIHPVRRSRGFAPLPMPLPVQSAPVLAVGGELKTTLCVARESHAWLSQHIGDTENLETLAMLERSSQMLCALQGVQPEAIISDLHPGYLSRQWAAGAAQASEVPHLTVQHHHAHAASLLAEHQWPMDEPVIVLAFDGSGYGSDGSIWGGEVLVGSYGSIQRVGHLATIPLPGGDSTTRRPLRTALAHLSAAGIDLADDLPPVARAQASEVAIVTRLLETGTGCTSTSSMGRLFDAVAALIGLRDDADYEGQAAIELEALAATSTSADAWPCAVRDEAAGLIIDPTPIMAAAVADLRSGRPRNDSARAFHLAIADAVTAAADLVRSRTGVSVVGLTGGVFSNGILTSACQGRLGARGFNTLTHRLVPPNDGGLALGQVAVTAAGGARAAGRV